MNNHSIEVLFARRPKLNYISPAICEALFSSTSFPTLVLEAVPTPPGITGTAITFAGLNGNFRLTWNNYPGALCYSVYRTNNATDPFGSYVLIAECISDPVFVPTDWGLNPLDEGCYIVTAITPEGETPFGDPICVEGVDISPEGPFFALVGEIYSQQLFLENLPQAPDSQDWEITSGALPAGVTLNPATGELAGVPIENGVFDFTVSVNGYIDIYPWDTTRAFQMQVTTTTPTDCITNSSLLPDGVEGEFYTEALISFAPLVSPQWTVVAGALPGGMSLDIDTGVIDGYALVAGTFPFTVNLNNNGVDCMKSFSITIPDLCGDPMKVEYYGNPGLLTTGYHATVQIADLLPDLDNYFTVRQVAGGVPMVCKITVDWETGAYWYSYLNYLYGDGVAYASYFSDIDGAVTKVAALPVFPGNNVDCNFYANTPLGPATASCEMICVTFDAFNDIVWEAPDIVVDVIGSTANGSSSGTTFHIDGATTGALGTGCTITLEGNFPLTDGWAGKMVLDVSGASGIISFNATFDTDTEGNRFQAQSNGTAGAGGTGNWIDNGTIEIPIVVGTVTGTSLKVEIVVDLGQVGIGGGAVSIDGEFVPFT